MKKLISLLLAVSMLLAVSVAFATEGEIEMDKSITTGTTTVSMTIDSSADTYVFTIPSAVVINPKTQYGYGTVTLKAGWELISVNGISISISSAANSVGDHFPFEKQNINALQTYLNFSMTSSDGQSVPYAIKASTLPYPLAKKDRDSMGDGYSSNYTNALISVTKGGSNTTDKTCDLTFYVNQMPGAGVYTDTLTFAITTN